MRKWWKDTNDPSGSFHSAVKEEHAIQSFSLPWLKVYGTVERFSENFPASVTVNPPAAHGPWVLTGGPAKTSSWALSSKLHEASGHKQSRASPRHCCRPVEGCGLYQVDLQCPAGEIVISIWKITCKWLWASILKNGVKGLDFCYCSHLSKDKESGGRTSAFPKREAKVCNNHCSVTGGSGSPELPLTSKTSRSFANSVAGCTEGHTLQRRRPNSHHNSSSWKWRQYLFSTLSPF